MITKQQTYNAAIYCRLSAEDNLAGESGSISTQRTLLTQYCKDKGFNIAGYYVDDGFSGTNFDRPDFERLMNDIDKGKINVVLTKDLSRFGRDYIQAGYFIEKVFERKNVRYIAVDDNIDTLNNNNDILMPIKNVLNDMYARDVSRKKGRQEPPSMPKPAMVNTSYQDRPSGIKKTRTTSTSSLLMKKPPGLSATYSSFAAKETDTTGLPKSCEKKVT